MDAERGPEGGSPEATQKAKRAGVAQVAKTLVFGLFAIGMKGTWEREGVRVTPGQIVVGALVGGVLLIVALTVIVRVVLRLAIA